jgi:hypothetical protein
MHYFPSWSEKRIMNMSWENLMMYLASIPRYESDDSESEQGKEKEPEPTGTVDLFNLHD